MGRRRKSGGGRASKSWDWYYLLMGLLALFGFHTVSWKGQPLTGFLGLIAGPFLGVLAAVILTVCIGGACLVAIRVFQALAGPEEDEEPEPTAEDTPTVDTPTVNDGDAPPSHSDSVP